MAQAQIQVQKQKIFASVFPCGSVKPPINHQRFAAKADELAKEAEETLRQGSRIILGIGGDGIAFGNVEDVGVDGDATEAMSYWTRYVNSCPMESLRDEMLPNLLDQESRKWDNFRLWNLASKWTREIGGDRVRRIFAKVLEGCISEFVSWSYAGVYEEESESQSEVVPHLRFWIRNIFAKFVMRFLRAVRAVEDGGQKAEVTEKDVKNWEDVAITRLGALRVSELFDIVVDWDATKSGIDDLKHYTTNPATRTFVTSNFINILQTRLLHPGASTVEILQVYISIIRAFRRLDPKGVLLDRIARVIRRNLRERDDTAKVIVSGLLSDTTDENGDPLPPDPETLTELALELNRHDEESSTNDADLDWDNMEWMPDPIDAAPDYMKSKNTDVIGSLISLFDSKDVFVKELQTALADRLLKKKADYDQEVSVLEHLKLRFGSSSLQACEVMLRDVLDSRKVDNVIRQDQGMGVRPVSPSRSTFKDTTTEAEEPQFHSKILSRLFWPTLQDQPFKIPDSILAAQSRYEAGFESLKQSRKLTWLNALGHVEVELDLTDRIFKDEVLPWQAAVIYAFQSDSKDTATDSEPVTRTVPELATHLFMSPTLVRSACIFWLSKSILAQSATNPNVFTVLETLPSSSPSYITNTSNNNKNNLPNNQAPTTAAAAASLAAAAEVAAVQAAKEANAAENAGKLALYAQFIVSLLTNQGAMPLARIKMMLGIVVPGGFGLSEEELRELLAGMVGEGRVETTGGGGVYRVVA
jgi:anaphase-promoting complex subunit 2